MLSGSQNKTGHSDTYPFRTVGSVIRGNLPSFALPCPQDQTDREGCWQIFGPDFWHRTLWTSHLTDTLHLLSLLFAHSTPVLWILSFNHGALVCHKVKKKCFVQRGLQQLGARCSLVWVTGPDPPTSGPLKTLGRRKKSTQVAKLNLPTGQETITHGFLWIFSYLLFTSFYQKKKHFIAWIPASNPSLTGW